MQPHLDHVVVEDEVLQDQEQVVSIDEVQREHLPDEGEQLHQHHFEQTQPNHRTAGAQVREIEGWGLVSLLEEVRRKLVVRVDHLVLEVAVHFPVELVLGRGLEGGPRPVGEQPEGDRAPVVARLGHEEEEVEEQFDQQEGEEVPLEVHLVFAEETFPDVLVAPAVQQQNQYKTTRKQIKYEPQPSKADLQANNVHEFHGGTPGLLQKVRNPEEFVGLEKRVEGRLLDDQFHLGLEQGVPIRERDFQAIGEAIQGPNVEEGGRLEGVGLDLDFEEAVQRREELELW